MLLWSWWASLLGGVSHLLQTKLISLEVFDSAVVEVLEFTQTLFYYYGEVMLQVSQ